MCMVGFDYIGEFDVAGVQGYLINLLVKIL